MSTSASSNATAMLAEYVLGVRPSDLPAAVRREGLRSFFNILGCTVGGSRHEAVAITEKALLPFAGPPQGTLVGRRRKTDLLTASLINTLSSSINTYDDTHAEAIVHPSGPVLGTLLAVCERRPVSGRDFLTAFTLGVEVVCRLSKAVSIAPAKGSIAWSQTGITGGVGAAVAAAKLMGLDLTATRRAIGIAASQAAGIRAVHGSICTALMPAQAGQIGFKSALLAEAGMTCSESALEARNGFVQCFAVEPHLPHLSGRLGEHFEVLGNTYKPYPCGIVIHPLIDGALELRAKHNLDAGGIERVSVKAAPVALALCDRPQPKDEFEGQVSLYQWVAAALIRGRAGIAECTDAAVNDPAIRAFRGRITVVADPAIAADGADISIILKDGRTLTQQVRHGIGSKDNPMTDRQLETKFESLADGVLSREQASALIAECWRLEELPDAATLVRLAA